ncbi:MULTISPECIES: alpha-xenorhabdolysin family binary toxin subunit B [unclassified Pseudomonas]|uniref:alpha-xenorhabdolysin family binary toxin subunit B n=1 Tax=unclassified Pseudomonas TaxID=196821 RepID=UPI00192AD432|nr:MULTISPECIES: alpha-xenorhabdolysin family binary toxin subunit B [unclassified Pseudomonas]MPS97362.1 hypothetical protein [Pseudomonas sp.]QQZ37336.1 alpha-xenorhabdolysin family binary toxin subunit B [Pseudomonas sp. SK2]WEZ89681.1 alpha-xenorhabdolysin family binary toxin subunit B [Pseudomonas sp. NyZ480]
MNDNVHVLPMTADAPELGKVLAATRSYTEVWQKGQLKFSTPLQENLERHMRLFTHCIDQTVRKAQRLTAELDNEALSDMLASLGSGHDSDVLAIAAEERDTVKSRLADQISHLGRELQALATLPLLVGTADQERLNKQQQNLVRTHAQLVEEHDREQQNKETVEKAIATLEANGLQTRFGGVVPSLDDLGKLAVPGGETVVTVEAVSKAVEQLQTLLGDVVEGMRYTQLQQERRNIGERVRKLAVQVRELVQRQATVTQRLAALEMLPMLQEQRTDWASGMTVVRQALGNFHTHLERAPIGDGEQLRVLNGLFKQLLTYQRQLLEQHRRAL